MSQQEVSKILEVDKKVRNVKGSLHGIDLWSLDQIQLNNDWDYSLPTIYSGKAVYLRNNMLKTEKLFKYAMKEKYSHILSKVNFNNVLIAGGSVSSVLCKEKWDNDLDLFIYGLSEEEANKKVESLIKEIYSSYEDYLVDEHKKSNKNNKNEDNKDKQLTQSEIASLMNDKEVRNVRNKNCISLDIDGDKVQIILRLYESISQILHGFDIGCSGVGYDGKHVYFTSLSKFSYEYMANVVDPSRRSTTYEKRLKKYYDRGFQLILPYLDIKKLKTEYHKYSLDEVCILPYFVFSYNKIQGNKIHMVDLLEWGTHVTAPNEEMVESDYQQGDLDEYKIFYMNLKALMRDSGDYYHWSERMNMDILKEPPYISRSRIIDFFDELESKICSHSTLNMGLFSKYFSEDLLVQLSQHLFIKKDRSFLKKIIEQKKEDILSKFDKIASKDHTKLSWITKNPTTQLTSSFNPILSDSKDWYGCLYLIDALPLVKDEPELNIYVEPKYVDDTSLNNDEEITNGDSKNGDENGDEETTNSDSENDDQEIKPKKRVVSDDD